jgi:hypothetical protein
MDIKGKVTEALSSIGSGPAGQALAFVDSLPDDDDALWNKVMIMIVAPEMLLTSTT